MIDALGRLLAWPLLALIWLYRLAISPWLGNNCRFEPSCSVYAAEALREHGVFRGTWLAAVRIGRCHAWGGSGYDPVPVDADKAEIEAGDEIADIEATLKERARVLNHAYGYVSRGNRAGGLEHIYEWLQEDPAPGHAWAWFFEQMLLWEVPDAAMVFAQQYLRCLLHAEDAVAAVKLMLRCQQISDTFRPLAEDTPQALVAARQCRADELVKFLSQIKRGDSDL